MITIPSSTNFSENQVNSSNLHSQGPQPTSDNDAGPIHYKESNPPDSRKALDSLGMAGEHMSASDSPSQEEVSSFLGSQATDANGSVPQESSQEPGSAKSSENHAAPAQNSDAPVRHGPGPAPQQQQLDANGFYNLPDRTPKQSLGDLSPTEKIVSHLSPQDTLNWSLANKAMNEKLGETGRQFMDTAYKNPQGNLPAFLGSSDPSEQAPMAYKMAGLDPQTKLQPYLGQGSLEKQDFRNQNGGFIGMHETPGQTQAELDKQNEDKRTSHDQAKQKIEQRRQELQDQGVPEKRWPKLPAEFKPKTTPNSAAPSGAKFEYHPGGGIHSNKIPSSQAMGGAYFKVDPQKNQAQGGKKSGKKSGTTSTESEGYRIGRYGSFTTGAQTGHFYDNIPDKGADPSRKYSSLSAEDLVSKGSAAEKAGNTDLAKEYQEEAQKRMEEKSGK